MKYRNDPEALLRAAIGAVKVHSPTSFSWFGQRKKSPRWIRAALSPHDLTLYLRRSLQNQLYTGFYCPGFPIVQPQRFSVPRGSDSARLISRSNRGAGCLECEWQVLDRSADAWVVIREGLRLEVPAERVITSNGSSAGRVSILFPRELPALSPGFYTALGDVPIRSDEAAFRVYWNINFEDAPRLTRLVTTEFNKIGVPFRLKVLSRPIHAERCDPAVLYVPVAARERAYPLIEHIYRRIAPRLRWQVPAMTKEIAPGVAIAEDPADRQSFGQHRCGIVAQGLIDAFTKGKKSTDAIFLEVADRFAAGGLSVRAPYLNSGSPDVYPFLRSSPAPKSRQRRVVGSGEVAFEIATQIGQLLVDRALWSDGQCTWLGSRHDGDDLTRFELRTLRGDFYGGTAGVAWFLGHLFQSTKTPDFRTTAIAAIRHSLANPGSLRRGLYSGALGNIIAAVRLAPILDDETIKTVALARLQELLDTEEVTEEVDLVSGTAGTIIGLLALGRELNDEGLIGRAFVLGEELLDRSEHSGRGLSWSSPHSRGMRNLTGLSHGTAGIAAALLELFAVTHDQRFSGAAQRAFDYERSWYNAEIGNWPDLRYVPLRSGREVPLHHRIWWCHGAPGIALSRLRAFEVTRMQCFRKEAEAATRTTHDEVTASRPATSDMTLCHGWLGNLEIVLDAAKTLGTSVSDEKNLIATALATGKMWRKLDPNPGLFLGLSGLGYFFLRLANHSLPSVLQPFPTWIVPSPETRFGQEV